MAKKKYATITNTVWWKQTGTVEDSKFTDEHFAPNLGKLIALAQREIEKVICLAACQKAKTATYLFMTNRGPYLPCFAKAEANNTI